ncbi:MAG: LacI family DNA-binding transcriptional regulator [Candidatus Zhuqueibacterota bacterium]
MQKPPQITLSDLAKILRVSTVTVSKALRDHPDISHETKQRVKDLAHTLGYTPNIIARNLSSKKSQIIGLVVPKIGQYFFPAIIKTIHDAAFNQGYETLLMISYENAEREIHQLQTLLSMRVDGLLISISEQTTDTTIFESIKKTGTPLVFFDRVIEEIGFSTVRVDDRQSAFRAVEYAIQLGHTKIAHLAGYPHVNIGRERYNGFRDALDRHNLPVFPQWVIEGGFSEEYGYQGFKKIIRDKPWPSVIFAVTFSVALGAYKAALETGVRIPEDMDLIFIGAGQVNPFSSASFASMHQPCEEMGQRAVDVLIEEINSAGTPAVQKIVLESVLKM